MRAKLAQLIHDSRLPVVVFSRWVLGRSDRTAQRYLAGGPIPDDVALFIERIEAVEHEGDRVTVRLRWYARNPKWNRQEIIRRRQEYFAGASART